MIIIIPLGGKGERFKKSGYDKPKPLIKVLGKEIICWLLDNLDIKNNRKIKKIIIPYNIELGKYRFESFILDKYKDIPFSFIRLDKQTGGACETILTALCTLNEVELSEEIMCCDGDNFFTENVINLYDMSKVKNCVFYFEDTNKDPIYSYISMNNNSEIIEMIEKVKISDHACCGIYCFESGITLTNYCKYVITNNTKQKGEFYLSTVVQTMIKDNRTFVGRKINSKNFICLGTPLQLKIFCNNVPRISAFNNGSNLSLDKYRICFDLDNTLVTFPKIKGDYTTVDPITEMINFVRYLKKLGNTIIIQTARRMKTHGGNSGKVMKDIGKITFDTLEKYDIPYDEIYFGKPYADFYIDDLAVNCFNNLEKELGFYQTKIDPRSFNELTKSSIETYIKRSHDPKNDLKGEIYWYENVPQTIKDMFPLLIKADKEGSYYEMEKIIGITVSKIFLSGDMSIELLNHILGSMNRIHTSITNCDVTIDMYANYLDKVKHRYKTTVYSKYQDHEKIFNMIISYFEKYKLNNRGTLSPIHGDTVLTNIMINQFGKIKFIDMKGKQGDKTTIYGDMFYDLAKLYQSLIGYDEILEGKTVNYDYKQNLIMEYEKYIVNKFGEMRLTDIKMITCSLLFSLIPLHDDPNKCQQYYNLCQTMMNTQNTHNK